MRVLVAVTLVLIALIGARVAPDPHQQDLSFIDGDAFHTTVTRDNASDSDGNVTITADLWQEAVDRGTKLLAGMRSNDNMAATLYGFSTGTAASPFDGPLIDELREWGYNDNTLEMQRGRDIECNMASSSGHMLSKAFAALGMDTASKGMGGLNECFQIEHFGGPVMIKKADGTLPDKAEQYYCVCGTTYRATGAEYTLGINAPGGALFALNRKSSPRAARELWRRRPEELELPHLRSASDMAWGVWNRAVSSTPGAKIENVKYFMNMMVINKESNQHIRRALSSLSPPLQEAPGWPGTEFSMESQEGKALLGSPVGRWAGYFLIQHKRQLGGNKWIEKVRVFRSEKVGSWPYLLFYVAGPEAGGGLQGAGKVRAKL